MRPAATADSPSSGPTFQPVSSESRSVPQPVQFLHRRRCRTAAGTVIVVAHCPATGTEGTNDEGNRLPRTRGARGCRSFGTARQWRPTRYRASGGSKPPGRTGCSPRPHRGDPESQCTYRPEHAQGPRQPGRSPGSRSSCRLSGASLPHGFPAPNRPPGLLPPRGALLPCSTSMPSSVAASPSSGAASWPEATRLARTACNASSGPLMRRKSSCGETQRQSPGATG